MMKISLDTVLEIAKKYHGQSYPLIEPAVLGEFQRVITWNPLFDGKTKDRRLAAKLSYDNAILGTSGIPNAALALACVVFDLAPDAVWAAQNLGCSIAMFCDNSEDPVIFSRMAEIYADAETVLLYAIGLSMINGNYSANSFEPLVCLGNLQLDMRKDDEADQAFKAASACADGSGRDLNPKHRRKVSHADGLSEYMTNMKSKPTVLQKAFIDLMEKTEKAESLDDAETEEEMERRMEELCKIETVTYADLFGPLDPATAAKMKADAANIGSRMKLTIPSMTVLTQHTTINEENRMAVLCALQAVGQAREPLTKHQARLAKESMLKQADTAEGYGFSASIGGMSLQSFIKKASDNPNQFKNAGDIPFSFNMGSMMSNIQASINDAMNQVSAAQNQASQLMSMGGSLEEKMKSGEISPKQFRDMMGITGKLDPLSNLLMMDPFDYANAWDVMVQQENVRLLQEKMSAIHVYAGTVLSKAGEALTQIATNCDRRKKELELQQRAEESKAYESHMKHQDKRRLIIDLHKVHTKYYPMTNDIVRPAFGQATQATAMGYKKLEKYIPMMYQTVMKHLMCISDEKVRDETERTFMDGLVALIATGMDYIVGAYRIGTGLCDIRLCGCDQDVLREASNRVNAQEKAESEAAFAKQQAARDSFKNGDVDMNSSFYKNFIKKYEYTIDLGVIKYRSNLHFRTKDVSLWTPIGSFNHSTYQNRMTGKTRVSADMSLGLDAKAVEGTASFGFSYARDRNGNVHPRDVDFRAGLEASAGIWPLTGTAGISASLVRGTKVYGGVEASAGYIDNVKEEIFGGIGELIPLESPTLELWSGEYSVTESN